MEHSLGGSGKQKAENALVRAIEHDGPHYVSLDDVIEVMYRTGMDMQNAYKETSRGGLAAAIHC